MVSKKAQNHEISTYFQPNLIVALNVAHLHNSEIQNALVSNRRTLLSYKTVDRCKYTASYA